MEGIFSMEKWRSIAAGMSCLSMLFATGAVTVSASDEITEIPEQSIVYWSMWEEDEPQADVIREAAEAYEEATGISVEIQWKGRGIRSLIEPALDAGEQIDLLFRFLSCNANSGSIHMPLSFCCLMMHYYVMQQTNPLRHCETLCTIVILSANCLVNIR